MVQRRTRALAELVLSTLLLFGLVRLRKFKFDYADEVDGTAPHPVSPRALTTGAVSGAIEGWLSDRDVCGIRTNWRRRLLFSLRTRLQTTLIQRYVSDPDVFEYDHAIGAAIGRIVYRLWYGLLHPLPGQS